MEVFELHFDWSVSGESSVLVEAPNKTKALEIFLEHGGPKIHLDNLEPQAFFVENPTVNDFYLSMLCDDAGDDDEIIREECTIEIPVNAGYDNARD